MSRMRRWAAQRALRVRVALALQRQRTFRVRLMMQRFCYWYLLTWRGYTLDSAVECEVDLAVLGLLRWAQSYGSASPWRFVKAQVAR